VRSYSVAIASLAIGAPAKWTDNLLAHHRIGDIQARSRGVARKISWTAVVRIALIRELHVTLGCGVREAVALSASVLDAPAFGVVRGPWLTLSVDRAVLERDLQHRLAEVLESAPRPRRGRPPRRTAGPAASGAGERS
jgi:hypothetical protein